MSNSENQSNQTQPKKRGRKPKVKPTKEEQIKLIEQELQKAESELVQLVEEHDKIKQMPIPMILEDVEADIECFKDEIIELKQVLEQLKADTN